MKLVLDWLEEYVKIRRSPAELAEALTMSVAEVEEIETAPEPVQAAVSVSIKEVRPHPRADRLKLVTVTDGKQEWLVVCGAANATVGRVAVLLRRGDRYYESNGQLSILKEAVIRGERSAGMLASGQELGLSTDQSGLYLLPDDTQVGVSLSKVLAWSKPVLKLEITPNRGDLLSYRGLAREIASIEKSRLNLPATAGLEMTGQSTPKVLAKIESKTAHRYAAVVLEGFYATASPAWLVYRLHRSGLESINPIVDVTNYVMLETGQPLHAFDYDLLKGNRRTIPDITVRSAKKGETVTSLDGTILKLTPADSVISSGGSAIALAGIVGTKTAAITNSTTAAVIEAAIFDKAAIRQTARRLNLITEAANRFEKGIDAEITIVALKRAVELLQKIGGGRPTGRLIDINHHRATRPRLSVSLERVGRTLGTTIEPTKAKQSLSNLGFLISSQGQNSISVLVPSWRNDITIEEDITEEIARLYGYDKLPTTLPAGRYNLVGDDLTFSTEEQSRRGLAGLGWREIRNQSFMNPALAQRYSQDIVKLVTVANPLSQSEQFLRPQLAPGLCERQLTESRQYAALRCFEIGHVFRQERGESKERPALALADLGSDPYTAARALKRSLELLMRLLEKEASLSFRRSDQEHPYLAGDVEQIMLGQKIIGELGVVRPEICRRGKLRGRRFITIAEVDLSPIMEAAAAPRKLEPNPRFPAIIRDLNIAKPADKTVAELINQISKSRVPHLFRVDLKDIFGDKLTLRLVFMAKNRTLTEKEVDESLKIVKING